jgi:hypothetical protein
MLQLIYKNPIFHYPFNKCFHAFETHLPAPSWFVEGNLAKGPLLLKFFTTILETPVRFIFSIHFTHHRQASANILEFWEEFGADVWFLLLRISGDWV